MDIKTYNKIKYCNTPFQHSTLLKIVCLEVCNHYLPNPDFSINLQLYSPLRPLIISFMKEGSLNWLCIKHQL